MLALNMMEVYDFCIQMYTIAEADDPPVDETADTVCSVCGADVGSVQCGGDPSHSLCSDCFDHYAVGAFQAGGAFCARMSSNGIESPRGVLPCPFFPAGECTCHEMPVTAIEHLSAQTLEQKDQAFRRLAEEQQEETRQNRHDVGPTDLSGMLLNAVQEVLFLGASVACPSCGYRGEKDGACMHITCGNTECRHRWCYCCGRSRNSGSADCCRTCDRSDPYIQNYPGWGYLQREPGESRGYGALHEFHRRRIAYFLRRFREAVPEAPWDEFWARHSDLLLEVPTKSRNITQRDIATAKPPTFSSTQLSDVRWLTEIDPIIERVRRMMDQMDETGGEDTQPRRDRWGRFWRRVFHLPGTYARRDEMDVNDEEALHVQLLVEEIVRNDTLDQDMLEVMLESLLNPIYAGRNNAAETILSDESLDDELRQALLNSLVAEDTARNTTNI